MMWKEGAERFPWLSRWRRSKEKFVLCRPCGGLNDMLCQIQACWAYSQKWSRTLVVDIAFAGLGGDLTDFFVPQQPSSAIRFDGSAVAFPVDATVAPPAIRGRLDNYKAEYSPREWNFVDVDSASKLTFDFRKNHRVTVLLHHQCGGGTNSFELLPRVVLSDEVRAVALERLAKLPEDYVAVHVRNTDYRTDYLKLFQHISPEVRGHPLLVCSDDAGVIRAAQRLFPGRVVTASDITDTNGRALHNYAPKGTHLRRREFINAIVDLLALGLAQDLHFTSVVTGQISGFSMLANHLHSNPGLIRSLLRVDTVSRGPSAT